MGAEPRLQPGCPRRPAKAWRNGWFHTGDAARRDADGNYYFVDRLKDAIRRRGENISSIEVEDGDRLPIRPCERPRSSRSRASSARTRFWRWSRPCPGRTLDPAELIEFLRPRMAHYMIPRYMRIVDELPKTPTAKVQKTELRREAITPDTWDREAAGVRLRREKLST